MEKLEKKKSNHNRWYLHLCIACHGASIFFSALITSFVPDGERIGVYVALFVLLYITIVRIFYELVMNPLKRLMDD